MNTLIKIDPKLCYCLGYGDKVSGEEETMEM